METLNSSMISSCNTIAYDAVSLHGISFERPTREHSFVELSETDGREFQSETEVRLLRRMQQNGYITYRDTEMHSSSYNEDIRYLTPTGSDHELREMHPLKLRSESYSQKRTLDLEAITEQHSSIGLSPLTHRENIRANEFFTAIRNVTGTSTINTCESVQCLDGARILKQDHESFTDKITEVKTLLNEKMNLVRLPSIHEKEMSNVGATLIREKTRRPKSMTPIQEKLQIPGNSNIQPKKNQSLSEEYPQHKFVQKIEEGLKKYFRQDPEFMNIVKREIGDILHGDIHRNLELDFRQLNGKCQNTHIERNIQSLQLYTPDSSRARREEAIRAKRLHEEEVSMRAEIIYKNKIQEDRDKLERTLQKIQSLEGNVPKKRFEVISANDRASRLITMILLCLFTRRLEDKLEWGRASRYCDMVKEEKEQQDDKKDGQSIPNAIQTSIVDMPDNYSTQEKALFRIMKKRLLHKVRRVNGDNVFVARMIWKLRRKQIAAGKIRKYLQKFMKEETTDLRTIVMQYVTRIKTAQRIARSFLNCRNARLHLLRLQFDQCDRERSERIDIRLQIAQERMNKQDAVDPALREQVNELEVKAMTSISHTWRDATLQEILMKRRREAIHSRTRRFSTLPARNEMKEIVESMFDQSVQDEFGL